MGTKVPVGWWLAGSSSKATANETRGWRNASFSGCRVVGCIHLRVDRLLKNRLHGELGPHRFPCAKFIAAGDF